MKGISAAAGIVALALTSCTATGTGNSIADVHGQVPSDYRRQIVEYVKETYKDPYTIRSAEISQPIDGFVSVLYGSRPSVCVRFNAKNSYGAYIGIKLHAFAFSKGVIIGELPNPQYSCGNVVYSPFKELENIA